MFSPYPHRSLANGAGFDMTTTDQANPSGLPAAITAYLIWGLLPLYLKLLHAVPPLEFIGWRILFTVPVCLAIVAVRRQGAELLAGLRSPKVVGALLLSSLLIGGNWLIYIVAVQSDHVLAASLGYYINPLINVLLGTLFLGERLSRSQWLAVAIAALGVSVLAWGAQDMLWISLTLAGTFAFYGLVRKLAPVASLPGLTIETLLLALPAAITLVVFGSGATDLHFGHDVPLSLLLAGTGIVTAVPLLLFALAARRMDYSALGFVQFLAPTMQFIVSLTIFHEALRPIQLAAFVLIWVAIGVFTWDLVAKRRAASSTQKLKPAATLPQGPGPKPV
ncbi:MAG: EamA family transporter RarD [Novosphingobium sp.]|nr:EamA family transporter RarD [Novosphingobium sp.]